MLLLIDHLALRARNYEYLIRLFQEWEVGARRYCASVSCVPGTAQLCGGEGRGQTPVPLALPPTLFPQLCACRQLWAGADRRQPLWQFHWLCVRMCG